MYQNKTKIELMSTLLRDLEAEMGTRDLATLVLQSLLDSVKSLKAKNIEDFHDQFADLLEVICSTEPKFGILNYHFKKLLEAFEHTICLEKNPSEKKWKKVVVRRIKDILKHAGSCKHDILKVSERLDVEGKTILIHDHSHTVQDVLVHYKHLGKHFKVVIAEQDFDKSHDNIEKMHKARIPFQVVPAYMLSHVHEQIDMLFFGALTLKDTQDFVMDPGTHSIISEFHIDKLPAYMFITTEKFSLWKSKKRKDIFIKKHTRFHRSKPIEYERIKYSHDRVPAKLFKKIVTNEGVFGPAGVEKLFWEKYEKFRMG
jgi:translation initiation factor 2B subunit (eIF-2B alpha/beta/delta family)